MGYKLSKRSLDRLVGVHPKLVELVLMAIKESPLDFSISEGMRTFARQSELVKAGSSRTMKSRHLIGEAVDIAIIIDGKYSRNISDYRRVADVFKLCAHRMGISITWGGDWKTLVDGPHFQIELGNK